MNGVPQLSTNQPGKYHSKLLKVYGLALRSNQNAGGQNQQDGLSRTESRGILSIKSSHRKKARKNRVPPPLPPRRTNKGNGKHSTKATKAKPRRKQSKGDALITSSASRGWELSRQRTKENANRRGRSLERRRPAFRSASQPSNGAPKAVVKRRSTSADPSTHARSRSRHRDKHEKKVSHMARVRTKEDGRTRKASKLHMGRSKTRAGRSRATTQQSRIATDDESKPIDIFGLIPKEKLFPPATIAVDTSDRASDQYKAVFGKLRRVDPMQPSPAAAPANSGVSKFGKVVRFLTGTKKGNDNGTTAAKSNNNKLMKPAESKEFTESTTSSTDVTPSLHSRHVTKVTTAATAASKKSKRSTKRVETSESGPRHKSTVHTKSTQRKDSKVRRMTYERDDGQKVGKRSTTKTSEQTGRTRTESSTVIAKQPRKASESRSRTRTESSTMVAKLPTKASESRSRTRTESSTMVAKLPTKASESRRRTRTESSTMVAKLPTKASESRSRTRTESNTARLRSPTADKAASQADSMPVPSALPEYKIVPIPLPKPPSRSVLTSVKTKPGIPPPEEPGPRLSEELSQARATLLHVPGAIATQPDQVESEVEPVRETGVVEKLNNANKSERVSVMQVEAVLPQVSPIPPPPPRQKVIESGQQGQSNVNPTVSQRAESRDKPEAPRPPPVPIVLPANGRNSVAVAAVVPSPVTTRSPMFRTRAGGMVLPWGKSTSGKWTVRKGSKPGFKTTTNNTQPQNRPATSTAVPTPSAVASWIPPAATSPASTSDTTTPSAASWITPAATSPVSTSDTTTPSAAASWITPAATSPVSTSDTTTPSAAASWITTSPVSASDTTTPSAASWITPAATSPANTSDTTPSAASWMTPVPPPPPPKRDPASASGRALAKVMSPRKKQYPFDWPFKPSGGQERGPNVASSNPLFGVSEL